MCSRNHGDVVLTAGKSIKLWDPINQTLIKVRHEIYIGTLCYHKISKSITPFSKVLNC